MITVNTREYKDLLGRCHAAKSPLYVYGGPGIGKSEIPRQHFEEYAGKENLEFREWTDMSLEEKMAAIEKPEKYFIFCDQRVGQMDTTDLRGIPNMVNTEMLETIPMSWVIYFTQPKAHGVIFFDELNLAAPVVAGQAYQIINDRAIADRRLGDDVWVFGAGNRAGIDKAHVFEMPFPLRDRFNEIAVEPDVKAWTEDYAAKNINSHLVTFVNWKHSYLYHVVEDSVNKSSTPRGITRASQLIGDDDITSDNVHRYVSMAVGEGFATEFQAYCKHYKKLDWNKIYANPDCVANKEVYKVDALWAIIGGMTEQFMKFNFVGGKPKEKKEANAKFEKMLDVVKALDADFAVVALRMMKDSDTKKFIGMMKECKKHLAYINKEYGKFILASN